MFCNKKKKSINSANLILFFVVIIYILFLSLGLYRNVNYISENFDYNYVLISDTTYLLPDPENNQGGLGFTCTGFAYDPENKCYYVGNLGCILPDSQEFPPTIVKISEDLRTCMGEIEITKEIPGFRNLQGVAVDTEKQTLWIASPTLGKIYEITENGKPITEIDYQGANGIAYDNETDSLWVVNNSSGAGQGTLANLKKTGEIIQLIPFEGIPHSDQVTIEDNGNFLYLTAGADYQGNNYVYKFNLTNGAYRLKYILADSYAVEGIAFCDDHMLICNDGYYHDAAIRKNIIQSYRPE